MRARQSSLVGAVFGALALASCGDGGIPEPLSPPVTIEPSVGAGSKPSASAPSSGEAPVAASASAPLPLDPPLKPIARDERRPCDAAGARRDRAKDLLVAGRAYRALRELDAAERACPADAPKGWKVRLGALVRLGKTDDARALAKQVVDAAGADAETKKAAADATNALASSGASLTSASLLTSAEAAAARGDASAARGLYDQALVRIEQEASAKASLVWARDIDTPLALSADGATAVLSRDKIAVIADAARLAPLRFLESERRIVSAALSRDGRLAVTVDDEGGTSVWATATGKRQRQIAWAGERATSAAFTSDGKRLAVISGAPFDTAIRLWNVETGDSIVAFGSERTGEPKTFAVSRDDKLMAVGTERGHLSLWEIGPKPKETFVLSNRESFLESVLAIAFSPKGDRVAALFESGTAVVWETAKGKELWRFAAPAAFQKPGGCAFSADGARLFAGWSESNAGATVRVWDALTGAELQNTPVAGRVVAFSDDVRRGLADGDSSVSFLDIAEMKAITSRAADAESVSEVTFGPPRVIAISSERDPSLRLLTPTGLRSLPLGESTRMIAPSFDGKSLAASIHGEITLWDIEAARAREGVPRLSFYPDSIALTPSGSVRATEVSSELILVTSGPQRDAFRTVFTKARGSVSFPTFTLATFGRRAIAVRGIEVGVVDAETGRAQEIDHGFKSIDKALLSPDGRVAMVIDDERLSRFDAETGASLGPTAALACGGRELSASYDGSRVASRCGDSVRVVTFTGGGAPGSALDVQCGSGTRDAAIAPHGDLIACAHGDGTVKIVRVDDGKVVGAVRFLGRKDAALLEAAGGRFELLGAAAADIEKELVCRVGQVAYPFELCRDAVIEPGLVAEVLGPR